MKKIKVIQNSEISYHKHEINKWCKDNLNIEIISITASEAMNAHYNSSFTAYILYEESKNISLNS